MLKKTLLVLLTLMNINFMFLTISIIRSSAQISSYIDELTNASKLHDNYISAQSENTIIWIVIINISCILLSLIFGIFKTNIKQYLSSLSKK